MSGNNKVSASFKLGSCEVCRSCGVNQYFNVNSNFIDYNGTFYSLSEILIEALDFHTSHNERNRTEICLDCKEKVITFYHFKRKVKEAHKQATQITGRQQLVQQKNKQSQIVQNILRIVESYTEKCSVSSIRFEESSKRLIIEPLAGEQEDTCASSTVSQLPLQNSATTAIKQEPEEADDRSWGDETSPAVVDFSDIVVKEEPEYMPIIFSHDLNYSEPRSVNSADNPRRFNEQAVRFDNGTAINVSKAALKMRAYRERLRKPENKYRYLVHLKQQREWNRKHYIKKQITTGKPIRSRRRRTAPPSLDFELNNMDMEKFQI